MWGCNAIVGVVGIFSVARWVSCFCCLESGIRAEFEWCSRSLALDSACWDTVLLGHRNCQRSIRHLSMVVHWQQEIMEGGHGY